MRPMLGPSSCCIPCIGYDHRGGSIRGLRPQMIAANHNLHTCNNQRENFYPKQRHEQFLVFQVLAQLDPCKRCIVAQTSCESLQYNEFFHPLIR